MSIVRGFMYAGATSVIASSWKVDDEATAELMERFYRRLFGGNTPAASLREAEISMYETRRFHDPYYWAGFELQGDWSWNGARRLSINIGSRARSREEPSDRGRAPWR